MHAKIGNLLIWKIFSKQKNHILWKFMILLWSSFAEHNHVKSWKWEFICFGSRKVKQNTSVRKKRKKNFFGSRKIRQNTWVAHNWDMPFFGSRKVATYLFCRGIPFSSRNGWWSNPRPGLVSDIVSCHLSMKTLHMKKTLNKNIFVD